MDLDVHLPAIQAGDARAFGCWVAGAEPSLRGGLRSFAGVVDTEAVLQEALLRAWQVAPGLRPDGRENALLRLAARIARNLAIDGVRRARVVPLDDAALQRLADTAAAPPPEPPDPHLRRLIALCRGALPDKPGAALTARLEAAGGEHDRALAARLGMRPNTFLKNVGLAKALLETCLRRHGVVWEGP